MEKILFNKLSFVLMLVLSSCFNLNAQKLIDESEQSFMGVKTVFVQASFCDVSIQGESRDDIDFIGQIRGRIFRSSRIKIQYKQEDDVLRVWIDRPNSLTGNIEGMIKLKVPSATAINVRNSSGDIYIAGVNSEQMKLKASSGDIILKDSKCNLLFKTSSGDVDIVNHVGTIDGESTSGDQQFSQIIGDITTETTSGDLELNRVKGSVESSTTSGDVDLIKILGTVSNQSTSGEVDLNDCEGAFQLRTISGEIHGQGVLLLSNSRFKTSSGDIQINLVNDIDELNFDLQSSSGSLRVGNHRGDKQIIVQNGNISIYGKSTSGDQLYY